MSLNYTCGQFLVYLSLKSSLVAPSASAVILAERHSQQISYANVAEALNTTDVDLRLFGKPDSRPYRRMGVALAKATTTKLAREKAYKAASTVLVQQGD